MHTRDPDQQFRRLPTLLAERAAALLQVRGRQRTHCRAQRPISSVECTLPLCCEQLQTVDRRLWRAWRRVLVRRVRRRSGRASGGPAGPSPEQEPRARSSREMTAGPNSRRHRWRSRSHARPSTDAACFRWRVRSPSTALETEGRGHRVLPIQRVRAFVPGEKLMSARA